MRAETQALVTAIQESLALLRRRLDWDTAEARMEEFDARAEDPELWNDPDNAQKVMRERQKLSDSLDAYQAIESEMTDQTEMIELGEMEEDDEVIAEAEAALAQLKDKADKAELEALLSGEMDGTDAFIEVNSGAGGTESCDWASMLARMYTRWAEKRGYKVETLEYSAGEEAGIKSVTYQIKGANAFGWLKAESGVHRLVRISPFDSQARRHTSFSSVQVSPVIDDTVEIDIQDKDIRIDTYRSSGAGGQHVNTTDSAVRITHIPSGIVVTSSEKSQHQNRANCMTMLRSRLYDLEMQKREEAASEHRAEQSDIGWGHQIRSYVLQPYQMVKDLRTGEETSDTQGVLDGNLDPFMGAALAAEVSGKSRAQATED